MERRISVGIFRPKYVDHLQRWSRIFRSEETETNLSIWITTEISGIFGKMESTPGQTSHSGQTQKSNATSGFRRLELRKSLKRKPARLQ